MTQMNHETEVSMCKHAYMVNIRVRVIIPLC